MPGFLLGFFPQPGTLTSFLSRPQDLSNSEDSITDSVGPGRSRQFRSHPGLIGCEASGRRGNLSELVFSSVLWERQSKVSPP